MLAWQTTNATAVTIDALGAVQPSGSQQIIPANATTYHLTAKGDGGTREASAQVTVTAPPTASASTATTG
jgi:peptidoglycan-associated lipoprotein